MGDFLNNQKNKLLFLILFICLIGGGYYYFSVYKNKTVNVITHNHKKIIIKQHTGLTQNKVKKKEIKNTFISDLSNVINNINTSNKYITGTIIKKELQQKNLNNLIKLGIIKMKNKKEIISISGLNKIFFLPNNFINFIKDKKIIKLITNIDYVKGTDLVIDINGINKMLSKNKIKITDSKFKITNYIKNNIINLSFYLRLSLKNNNKIKVNGKLKIDVINKMISFSDITFIRMKNFDNVINLLINKYIINSGGIANINETGKILKANTIQVEYTKEKQNIFRIIRRGNGIIKFPLFEIKGNFY